ncbi:MAG TPA: hypothetical protein VN158_08885 [Caulobacter sp.]|nr:hypothetical protein [Caulobacter sp.]
MKVAIITPYHQESADILWRCHASVRAQTYPATHFMVSDGFPNAAAAKWDVQHLRLPAAHADGGDTPRGLGALSALNQGYDAVGFLDADNWLADDHVESCLATCARQKAPIALASRQIVLSSGQYCAFEDRDVVERRHVDTSCFFMLREAAAMMAVWAMIDPRVWQACDRIMLSAIRARGLGHAWTGHKSVYYNSHWGLHFLAMGLPPPADEHQIDWDAVAARYDAPALVSRLGFDPDLDFSNNDHAAADDGAALSFLSRVVMSGRPIIASARQAPPTRVDGGEKRSAVG